VSKLNSGSRAGGVGRVTDIPRDAEVVLEAGDSLSCCADASASRLAANAAGVHTANALRLDLAVLNQVALVVEETLVLADTV
jgi:hypothetical protein